MVEIFRKTVEKPEISGRRFKLSSSEFLKLPPEEFKVRDNRSRSIWRCRRSERSRQYYLNVIDGKDFNLNVIDGNDFVRDMKAGRSEISLHNESDSLIIAEADPSKPDATTPYKFEVENN
ncbi:hypothetical protein SLEP1_g59230 [Rubroshorea leprosula]|uniref:Uncharacterized protein n=1 Tax=Rubroshorea leprosula TaxID=152421 RepID=A0AAV5MSW4_9ROSI|nr:hypothetical protein SLEP1_g59230 [Rubroshorea leprosula]